MTFLRFNSPNWKYATEQVLPKTFGGLEVF